MKALPPISWIFTGEWQPLDNFYASPLEYNGKTYATAEHAFQAAKTLRLDEAELVRTAPTPAVAKAMGQLVTKRDDWEAVRVQVMTDIVRIKFHTHTRIARKLLS